MDLHVNLLGPFEVWCKGKQVTSWFDEPTKTLFKILASEPGRHFHKDTLIERLWPDLDPEQSNQYLNNRIHQLRKLIEPSDKAPYTYIVTVRNGYSLNVTTDCEVDIVNFEQHLETAQQLLDDEEYEGAAKRFVKARALYRGDFLSESVYQDWTNDLRSIYKRHHVDGLLKHSECRARLGEYFAVLSLCEEALVAEPYRDDICRQAMTYHFLSGNQNKALEVFQSFARRVAQELDSQVDPETRQLLEQILTGNVPGLADYPTPKALPHEASHSLGLLPFVGREREFDILVEALTGVQHGRGQIAVISGSMGTGKTRLMQEAMRSVADHGQMLCLYGYCSEPSLSEPYQSLLQMLRQAARHPVWQKIELPMIHRQVLLQWHTRLEKAWGPLKPPPALEPEAERLRLFEALGQVFFQLAKLQPALVLFLDDLHWANVATIEFLDYLMMELDQHALAVCIAYRNEEIHNHAALIPFLDRCQRGQRLYIELSDLDLNALELLVEAESTPTVEAPLLAKFLYTECGGNAFYLTEVLQSLFEENAISLTKMGKWRFDMNHILRNHRHLMTQSIESLLWRRVQQLDSASRQILELAAVIGRQVPKAILWPIWHQMDAEGLNEISFLTKIDFLKERQFLVEDDRYFSLFHDKVREVVFARIGQERQRHLHTLVFKCLHDAKTSLEFSHRFYAHHAARANQPQEALLHLLPALEEAYSGYRLEEGLDLFDEGWQLLDALEVGKISADEIFQARMALLEAKIKLFDIHGDRIEQANAIQTLMSIATENDDEEWMCYAYLLQAQHLIETGDYPQAEVVSLRARKLAEPLQLWPLQADSLHNIGRIRWHTGDYDDAYANFSAEFALRTQEGIENGLGQTLRYLGLVAWRTGQYKEAEELYGQALGLYKQFDDLQGQALMQLGWGIMWWTQGLYKRATEAYQEAIQIAADIGDRRSQAKALGNLGLTYWSFGEYEHAKTTIEQALDVQTRIGDKRAQGLDFNNLGLVHVALGDFEQAEQYFEQASALFRAVGWSQGIGIVDDSLALLYRQSGKLDQSLLLYQATLTVHKNSGDQRYLGRLRREYGDLLLEMGGFEQALEQFELALIIAKALSIDEEKMHSLSGKAVAHLRLNQPDQAQESSAKAVKFLSEIEDLPHQLLVWFNHYLVHKDSDRQIAIQSLKNSQQALITLTQKIKDEALVESFLSLPLHQLIKTHYEIQMSGDVLTEENCYQLLREFRWPNGVRCIGCDNAEIRAHGRVSKSFEKRYICKCGRTFSDRTDTPFASKKISMDKLFLGLVLVEVNTPKVSHMSKQDLASLLSERLDIHAKTASKLGVEFKKALTQDGYLQRLAQHLEGILFA